MTRTSTLSEFAKRLLARANTLGLSKVQLAAKAGISRQTLENLLKSPADGRDRPTPSVRTCMQLAEALRVHPAWIVEGLFVNALAEIDLDIQMERRQSPNVEHVNFPDGVVVAPLTRFEKRWRVSNRSDQPWAGLQLVCQDHGVVAISKTTGEPLYATDRLEPDRRIIELPPLVPGETTDVGMVFSAPHHSGTSLSRWLAVDGKTGQVDEPVWGVWAMAHVTTLADTIAFEPLPE